MSGIHESGPQFVFQTLAECIRTTRRKGNSTSQTFWWASWETASANVNSHAAFPFRPHCAEAGWGGRPRGWETLSVTPVSWHLLLRQRDSWRILKVTYLLQILKWLDHPPLASCWTRPINREPFSASGAQSQGLTVQPNLMKTISQNYSAARSLGFQPSGYLLQSPSRTAAEAVPHPTPRLPELGTMSILSSARNSYLRDTWGGIGCVTLKDPATSPDSTTSCGPNVCKGDFTLKREHLESELNWDILFLKPFLNKVTDTISVPSAIFDLKEACEHWDHASL